MAKTGRLVVVDECHRRMWRGRWRWSQRRPSAIWLCPPIRITTADVPIPFSPPLEQHIEPTTDQIIAAVRVAARVTSG